MIELNQGKLADGMVEELLDVIHKYEETTYVATVVGCLEIVKQQVLLNSIELDEEEDD